MNHLAHDLMRLGPAPTLAREIPVAVLNLLIAGALVAVLAVTVDDPVPAITLAVVALLFVAGRLLTVARKPRATGGPR